MNLECELRGGPWDGLIISGDLPVERVPKRLNWDPLLGAHPAANPSPCYYEFAETCGSPDHTIHVYNWKGGI